MPLRSFSAAMLVLATLPISAQSPAPPADLAASVEHQLSALTETYKYLHRNPELSRHEEKTAGFLTGELRKLGYTVSEHLGKYKDGTPGFGFVAVLDNGPGKRLMLRTELDALPVVEKTGLDYASTVKAKNAQGLDVGVMQACGHDVHMTVFLGVAREMAARKSQWRGMLMLVGQPAEETIEGAQAMLDDRFYERFPKPDFIVAEHDFPDVPAGSIAVKGGPLFASATSLTVTMRGIGGHGSVPQLGKDPIVLASEFVLAAQTIVSRQIDPREPAVLTVGTIHGGTKNNIIPDEVSMGLTLRSFSIEQRDQIIAAIRRTANGLAEAYGIPADRMPTVTVDEGGKVTENDSALADRIRAAAEAALGKDRVLTAKAAMGSEDVGLFSLDGQIPFAMYILGAAYPDKLAESQKSGVPLPSLHSALFYPDYAPAISTGVTAMTAMSLDLLH